MEKFTINKISIFLVTFLSFGCFSIFAEEPEVIQYNDGIKKLLSNNAAILQSNAVLISFKSNISRAENLRVPSVNLTTFVAPTYETKGDAFSSSRNYYKWGPAYYGEVTISMPIFTFHSIQHAREAAEKGYEASKYLMESEVNEQLMEFKKIYLGQILIKKLDKLLNEANGKMNEIKSLALERYNNGDASIQRKDIARLKIYALELENLTEQINMQKKNSYLALGHFMGEKKAYVAKEDEFPDIEFSDKSIDSWLAHTSGNPVYRASVSGLEAYRHSYILEKKKALPVIFLGLQGSYSHTGVREDQQSIYARDPYNNTTGAAVIGAKWNFDWSKYKSGKEKSYSDLEKAKEQRKEAETGIPLKIAMAYHDVVYHYTKWKNDQKKYKEAMKWFMSEYGAFSSGTGKTEDLMESLALFYLSEKTIYESEYAYLLSVAKLMKEVGDRAALKSWNKEIQKNESNDNEE